MHLQVKGENANYRTEEAAIHYEEIDFSRWKQPSSDSVEDSIEQHTIYSQL